MNLNKNISVWRGNNTPPTDYHLWIKENGDFCIKIDNDWITISKLLNILDLSNLQKNVKDLLALEIVETDDTEETNYKSYELLVAGERKGTRIDIPRDRFINDVKLGYSNATVDYNTGAIDIGTGDGDPLFLIYSMLKANGGYTIIKIDLTKFITEKEYGDGLELNGNKLKVKIDPTSKFLSVSNRGVKVSGIPFTPGDGSGSAILGVCLASGDDSLAIGYRTEAKGHFSFAEGYNNLAKGAASHVEGYSTLATCAFSHAEGVYNYDTSDGIYMLGVGDTKLRKNAQLVINTTGSDNGYTYFLGIGNYQGQEITSDTKSLQEVISDINSDLIKAFTKIEFSANPTIIEKGIDTNITLKYKLIYNGNITTPDTLILESITKDELTTDTSSTSFLDTINDDEMYSLLILYKGLTINADIVAVNSVYPQYYCASTETFNSNSIAVLSNKQTLKKNPVSNYSGTFNKGQYLWLCVPQPMTITRVTSSGFDIPMDSVVVKLINNTKYNCYRSADSFNTGTVNFVIYGS